MINISSKKILQSAHFPSTANLILFLYALGVGLCAFFFIISVTQQDPLLNLASIALNGIALIAGIVSFILLYKGNMKGAFFIFSATIIFVILLDATIHCGLNSTGLYILYPVMLMMAISSWDKPRNLIIINCIAMIWVIVILILEANGVYADHINPVSREAHIIFIAFSIFFTVVMLQVILVNFLNMTNNLTEAKEEALEAQTLAELASQSKSTFLATMSHELRTPLNAIIGYSEMISEDANGYIQEDAEKIKVSGSNLLHIINSILEISKIEVGSIDIAPSTHKIRPIIDEVSILIQPQIAKKGNSFSFEIAEETKTVFADRQKLIQILINLLSNANKFTTGGEIHLVTETDTKNIIFSVTDTGVGIPKDALEKIFVPFEQANSEYSRIFDGAGLGLSICDQLATLMNGKITVKSEEGKGSTFSVSVPAI